MPTFCNQYYPLRNIIFFVVEGWFIFLSLLVTTGLLADLTVYSSGFTELAVKTALVSVVFQLCLYFFDLYDFGQSISGIYTLTRMSQAFGVGCVILGSIYYFSPDLIIPSGFFWPAYFVVCVQVLILRSVYYFILRKKMFVQSVLLVGTGKAAQDIIYEVEGKHDSPYKIIGLVGENPPPYNPRNVTVYGDMKNAVETIGQTHIDRIVVALDDSRGSTPIHDLLHYKLNRMVIEHGANFFERTTGKILVERIVPSLFIYSDGFQLTRFKYLLKRILDIVCAVLILIVTAPILFLTAILIKLDSPGKVFYQQERVGEFGKNFKIVKFRSMVEDAEKGGAVWARENDNRVTRLGAIIRKLRIDELPQLWNVLLGEMSLVGPRPERDIFVQKLEEVIPYYGIRHQIKPGITGWAQINYPYGASEEDALRKLEYDLYYMKNISILFDIFVLFRTVKTVFFGKGAR